MIKRALSLAALTAGVTLALVVGSVASARTFTNWSPVLSAEQPGGSPNLNTEALEGCPIESLDGRSLFFASNRPGGLGGIDIWVATRNSSLEPWGEPYNPGAPINSSADDFCPTPVTSRVLFFVSTRNGGCGGPDIYEARRDGHGWGEPLNLGCEVNSSAAEFSPSIVHNGAPVVLYFSSNRSGGYSSQAPDNDHDIYMSRLVVGTGGFATWTTPEPVPGLNTAFDDARPNVLRSGHEIVFDSTRPGGLGGSDIWSASRDNPHDEWETPVNLGPNVNSSANESRPTLSRDGKTLTVGSSRSGGEGSSDIYVSTREKVR